MRNYHLLPEGDGWKLTSDDGGRSLFDFDSRGEGIHVSVDYLRYRFGSLTIHRADGSIEEERNFPRPFDDAGSPG